MITEEHYCPHTGCRPFDRRPLLAFEAHLEGCNDCRRAVIVRLSGASMEMMARRCCPAGRPLYLALWADHVTAPPPPAEGAP